MTNPISVRPAELTRALATVEQVVSLHDIPDADNIVRARIRGWDVVVKRGEFDPGDRCLYVEVDAMLDTTDPRFAFLEPRGVRTTLEGRRGHVLKTARLRGQYSQGLALPLAAFPEVDQSLPVGADVTDLLQIVKWDPPIVPELAGKVRGLRPSWITATDEERLQNLSGVLDSRDVTWIATEKIDGCSTTFYADPLEDYHGVCSRNLDLLRTDGHTMWSLGDQLSVHERLSETFPGQRAVVQGETYGEGIQGNPLRLRGHHFAAFTLWAAGREIPRGQWPSWLQDLSVPTRDFAFPSSLEQALEQVETLKSALAPERAAEGLVWRAADRADVTVDGRPVRASFKVVSNRYLLRHDRWASAADLAPVAGRAEALAGLERRARPRCDARVLRLDAGRGHVVADLAVHALGGADARASAPHDVLLARADPDPLPLGWLQGLVGLGVPVCLRVLAR